MHHHTLVDLYIRKSKRRDGEYSTGAQESELRAWAVRMGLEVRKVFIDNGKSGYKKGVKRDGFDDALAAVTAGVVGTLAVFKLDRLSRQGMGQVGLVLDAVAESGGRIVSVRDGLDSSVSGQRIVFAVVSEQARSESENISTRVRSARAEARRLGKWPAGSPPYGLLVTADKTLTPDTETSASYILLNGPSRADIARFIHMELQAGKSGRRVAGLLNSAGFPGPSGGPWSSSSVLRIAYAPAVAGLLPERVKREDGKFTGATRVYIDPETGSHVVCGVGPVTPAERLRTLAALSSRVTVGKDGKPRGKRTTTRHILTDLLNCPGCGRRMARSWQNYICASRDGGKPCVTPSSIRASIVEAEVKRRWVSRLTASEPDDPFLHAVADMWIRQHKPEEVARRQALVDEIEETRVRLDDLEEGRYVRGEFKTPSAMARYEKLHSKLDARLSGLQDDLAALPTPSADISPLLDPDLVEQTWDAADDAEKRALLRLAVRRITVARAPARGQIGDLMERVRIKWVDEPERDTSPSNASSA